MKRQNYIDWDTYFMGISLLSGKRSKDPATQVGACIVRDNKILSIGYNGFPNGCNDDDFPWDKSDNWLNSKYPYVCHAELNAILNAGKNLTGATIYVNLFPCNECAKAIIQSGIKEIVYLSDKDNGKQFNAASKRMLEAANIKTRKMEFTDIILSTKEEETLDFKLKNMYQTFVIKERGVVVEIHEINPKSIDYNKKVFIRVYTCSGSLIGMVEQELIDKKETNNKIKYFIDKYKEY